MTLTEFIEYLSSAVTEYHIEQLKSEEYVEEASLSDWLTQFNYFVDCCYDYEG